VFRFPASNGEYHHDVLGLASESFAGAELLLEPVMENGRLIRPLPKLEQIQARAAEHLTRVPAQYKRLETSESYPVEKSSALGDLLEAVRSQYMSAPVAAGGGSGKAK
jgi:nicotinate phosphoribosyltransferase